MPEDALSIAPPGVLPTMPRGKTPRLSEEVIKFPNCPRKSSSVNPSCQSGINIPQTRDCDRMSFPGVEMPVENWFTGDIPVLLYLMLWLERVD